MGQVLGGHLFGFVGELPIEVLHMAGKRQFEQNVGG
jgi:hypothetical protein